MPELVENGPDIPVELLNRLDDEQVVFFCGAGISVGTGLPNFKGLVKHVYKEAHLPPDAAERIALDLDEPNEARRQPKLDKVLELLERPNRLGSDDPRELSRLRQIVIKRLSKRSTGSLKVHRALIDLSQTSEGLRLVTTNFDNRFRRAGLSERDIDSCPRLPVPKPHDWHSLVHLHGRIMPGENGRNLVLTASDFGRAYLTERWASRFITELFREFTVVFVGYSLDDPVMSYMVDALAAERSRGAHFGRAFAFAAHDGNAEDRQQAVEAWTAKNVEPIPYAQYDKHKLLNDTLIEWARIRKDPFAARTQIALNEINKLPDGPADNVAARVTWALQDPTAAQELANAPPITIAKDFKKITAWLDVFDEAGLLSQPAKLEKGQDRFSIRLVDSGMSTQFPPELGQATRFIAFWIARHIHVPDVVEWVARKGSYMHPLLRASVREKLAKPESTVPERLRYLWTVMINQSPTDLAGDVWISDQLDNCASENERSALSQQLINRVTPRLKVIPGPSSYAELKRFLDHDAGSKASREDECAHLELSLGERDTLYGIEQLLTREDILSACAEDLTLHLHRALALLDATDEREDLLFLERPSIADHEQNRHRSSWLILIDWVRDSFLALAKVDRARADALLLRWAASNRQTFKRLVLHALAEDSRSDIRLAEALLLKGRQPGLFDMQLRRETLRFLRKAGKRIPRDMKSKLRGLLEFGPGRGGKKPSEQDIRFNQREIGLRYHKLEESGVRLSKKAAMLAKQAAPTPEDAAVRRDEFLSWSGEARWVGPDDFAPREYLNKPFTQVAIDIRDNKIREDGLEGLALMQPVKCASAMRFLARTENWPSKHWQRFLWAIANLKRQENLNPRVQNYVAILLSRAPLTLLSEIGSAAGEFVQDIADTYTIEREPLVAQLWNKAWSGGAHDQKVGTDDPLTQSLNHALGKLAEAALLRMWKYEPKTNSGLPEPVSSYFDTIASDSNGHLGRVMLATRLYQLFSVDPNWTSRNLIPLFTPSTSDEARDLWAAYGWSPTIGPNLLAAIRGPFLELLRNFEGLGKRETNLVSLFMSICLEAPNEVTDAEVRDVMQALPEEALVTVIQQLKRRLEASKGNPEATWKSKVGPWLKNFWPSAAEKGTSSTSEAFLELLLKTGKAFPEAVTWARSHLRPIQHHGLYSLRKSGLPVTYPRKTFDLLRRVVSEELLPRWEKGFLREILDELKGADVDIASEAEYQRLYRIATGG